MRKLYLFAGKLMKKNYFKSVALVAVVALSGLVLISCGSGGGSSKSNVPTDGPLGEAPLLIAQYYGTESSTEGVKSLSELTDAIKAAVEEVKGNEIALEVDENLPFKANGSLKVSECNNPIEIACYADAEELGKTGATTTAYIVFDKNGEVISVESGETTDNCFNSYTKKIKVTFRLQPYNATRYANVGKVAIILQDSEAYKKAADQLKALQEDFISKKQK